MVIKPSAVISPAGDIRPTAVIYPPDVIDRHLPFGRNLLLLIADSL